MGSKEVTQHEIIQDLRRVTIELEGNISEDEYFRPGRGQFSHDQIKRSFISFGVALIAAGIRRPEAQPKKKDKPFRHKPRKMEGHFIHDLDLDALFERAGNPEFLRCIAWGDLHRKYADPHALDVSLQVLEDQQPDIHLIGGDFIDAEGISHWENEGMEPRRFVPECKQARDTLAEIVRLTPNTTTRIYLEGNHEDWINQAQAAKMPEFFDGIDELGYDLTLAGLLKLKDFGYELFPVNHFVKIGKLYTTHGIYTGDAHAKKHLMSLFVSVAYGHVHDTQVYDAKGLEGHLCAFSLGCLCLKNAKFLRGKPNNWVHCNTFIEFFRDGSFNYSQPKIINGQMTFGNKIYRSRVK